MRVSPLGWASLGLIAAFSSAAGAGPKDVNALVESYRQARELDRRLAIVGSLGDLKTTEAVNAIGQILRSDPNESVRLRAADVLASQGSAEAARSLLDAISEWDPWVTQAVIAALSKAKPPAEVVAWMLDDGLEKGDDAREAAVVTILGALDHPDAVKAIRKRTRDKRARIRRAAAQALRVLDPKDAFKQLKRLVKDKNVLVRVAAIDSLGGVPGDAPEGLLIKLIKRDDAWQVRLACVRALQARSSAFLSEAMIERASNRHETWQVRAECIDALAGIRIVESVDALVGLLESTEGRLHAEARRALQRLVAKRLDSDDDWRAWWAGNREGFEFPAAGTQAPAAQGLAENQTRTRTFFSLPLESLRPCFVIDCSGSMSEPAPKSLQAATREQGAKPDPNAVPLTKFQVAKRELERALKSLPSEARFGVILFRERTIPVQELSVPAKPKHIARVLELIETMSPEGATDVYGPLSTVLHGSKPADAEAADLVEFDTIMLLSDGLPTAGSVTDPNEIRRRVRAFNQFARVRIQTIGIGQQNREFLEGLANDTGGRYLAR